MVDVFAIVKWVHILSATVVFGTGLGTAFFLWSAHRAGDAKVIAAVARITIRADWIFTTPAGIIQPLTGFGLVIMGGYDPLQPWLVITYCLYALAFACWAPVVWLQIQVQKLAAATAAAGGGTPLPRIYYRYMRLWFWLGWPAFIALIIILAMMVAPTAIWWAGAASYSWPFV